MFRKIFKNCRFYWKTPSNANFAGKYFPGTLPLIYRFLKCLYSPNQVCLVEVGQLNFQVCRVLGNQIKNDTFLVTMPSSNEPSCGASATRYDATWYNRYGYVVPHMVWNTMIFHGGYIIWLLSIFTSGFFYLANFSSFFGRFF